MNKAIENWLKSATYDLKTAETMFDGKRYIYVIFMCHLCLEKALKAVVCFETKSVPPKTHDLKHLMNLSKLEIPVDYQKVLSHLNSVSIPTRYPEDMEQIVKQYNRKAAQHYLGKTKEVFQWLKSKIK